jgi:phage gpG-like protein
MRITITGDRAIIDKVRTWPTEVERTLVQIGAIYEGEVKKQLSLYGGAIKRAYPVSFRRFGKRRKVWSKRGNSYTMGGFLERNPTNHLRVLTGRLRSSITHALVVRSGGAYEVEVGTNVVYARIHEYGAPAGKWKAWGRVAKTDFPARPYMKPVADDAALSARVAGMIGNRLIAVVEGGRT